jgi:hypothetical protein
MIDLAVELERRLGARFYSSPPQRQSRRATFDAPFRAAYAELERRGVDRLYVLFQLNAEDYPALAILTTDKRCLIVDSHGNASRENHDDYFRVAGDVAIFRPSTWVVTTFRYERDTEQKRAAALLVLVNGFELFSTEELFAEVKITGVRPGPARPFPRSIFTAIELMGAKEQNLNKKAILAQLREIARDTFSQTHEDVLPPSFLDLVNEHYCAPASIPVSAAVDVSALVSGGAAPMEVCDVAGDRSPTASPTAFFQEDDKIATGEPADPMVVEEVDPNADIKRRLNQLLVTWALVDQGFEGVRDFGGQEVNYENMLGLRLYVAQLILAGALQWANSPPQDCESCTVLDHLECSVIPDCDGKLDDMPPEALPDTEVNWDLFKSFDAHKPVRNDSGEALFADKARFFVMRKWHQACRWPQISAAEESRMTTLLHPPG